jgi:hypothetical protein
MEVDINISKRKSSLGSGLVRWSSFGSSGRVLTRKTSMGGEVEIFSDSSSDDEYAPNILDKGLAFEGELVDFDTDDDSTTESANKSPTIEESVQNGVGSLMESFKTIFSSENQCSRRPHVPPPQSAAAKDSELSQASSSPHHSHSHPRVHAITTLFSSLPIKATDECKALMERERAIIVACLFVTVFFGPLIFRYGIGSSRSTGDDDTVVWGSAIDSWECYFLSVLFLAFITNVFRMLPQICGAPAAVESSQKCILEGQASLGCCSPFCSEDEAILLRSFIGRTNTIFFTCGGRHEIEGMYVDSILNEKRLKGENNRINQWVAWMQFLTTLVEVWYAHTTATTAFACFDSDL